MDLEEYKKELRNEFENWIKEFNREGSREKEASRGKDAIDRIYSLSIHGPEEARLHLIGDICNACFQAANHDTPLLKDKAKKYREEIKTLLETIPGQLKSLKSLIKFASIHPENVGIAFKNTLMEMKEQSPLLRSIEGWREEISGQEFLQEIFSIYEKGLNYLQEGLIKIKGEKLMIFRISGYLIYPESLNQREMGANPAENNLLIHLAFLFREYTNPNFKHKDWPFDIEGTLPDYGNPCYDLIADLANAVFYPDGHQDKENKEFNPQKVGDRIRKLQSKGVFFTVHPDRPPPPNVDY